MSGPRSRSRQQREQAQRGSHECVTSENQDDVRELRSLLVDTERHRFATRIPGDFLVKATSIMGNIRTQTVSVGDVAPLESTSDVLEVPENVAIFSQEVLTNVSTEGSTVTSLVFGDSVVEIDPGVLSWRGLESISVEEGAWVPHYTSEDGVLFTADGKGLVAYPPAKKSGESYSVPVNTEVILSEAFIGASVTSVALPSTLKTIEEGVFTNSSVESLTLPDNVTSFTSTEGEEYSEKNIFYIFENDFRDETFNVALSVDLSASSIYEETIKRFKLQAIRGQTSFSVDKSTSTYPVKAKVVYTDREVCLGVYEQDIQVRVVMNY